MRGCLQRLNERQRAKAWKKIFTQTADVARQPKRAVRQDLAQAGDEARPVSEVAAAKRQRGRPSDVADLQQKDLRSLS
jgi:hypothetical protein